MSSSTRSPAAGRPVRRTRLLVPLIVLGVLGAAGALYLNHISARWVPDAEAKVRAARQLQAEQAFAEIERQARAQPQAVAPQLAYAQALADRQSFMAALLPAERAVQDDPRNADAHLLLAMIYTTLAYNTEAVDHYRQAIRLRPDGLEAYQKLGDLLLAGGDTHGAEQVFLQAQVHAPNATGPRLSLAQLYLDQGKARAALETLEPALTGASVPVAALYLAGKACQSLGQTQRGADLLRQATQKQPDFADAYHTLGSLLCNQSDYAEGIPALEKAITLAPDNANYRYALGNALLSDMARPDRLQAARAAFEASLERDPTSVLAHYYYGVTMEQMGEMNGALREYQHTLELSPGYGSAYYRLAAVYKALGRKDEADRYYKIFDRASKVAITQVHDQRRQNSVLDTAEAHFQRGVRSMQQGDMARAAADFRVALQRDPSYAPARRALQTLGERQP